MVMTAGLRERCTEYAQYAANSATAQPVFGSTFKVEFSGGGGDEKNGGGDGGE